ncbi:hypothetical protein SARC_15502, partial [Sphaeroforma arctica JP610]
SDEELRLWEGLYKSEGIAVNNTPTAYLRYLALHSVSRRTLNPFYSGEHGVIMRDEVQAISTGSHVANGTIASGLTAAAVNELLDEKYVTQLQYSELKHYMVYDIH